MPQYKYTARDARGKTIKGKMDSPDEKALYHSLKQQELYLLTLKCVDEEKAEEKGKIKMAVVEDFCRQIGTLLQAGVSLVRSLNIIAEEEGLKDSYKAIYGEILQLIRQGIPLSEAMEAQGRAFPPLLVNMMRAAEANGNISQTSMRMADHYDKERKLNGKVKSAMVYPMILSVLLVGVIIFIMTYLVPQFQGIFDQMETLPLPTVILLAISKGFQKHWFLILIAVIAAVIATRLLLRVSSVRLRVDRIKLRLPIIGKLLKKIYTARFARTLSSLYSSGLPIVTALQVGGKTIGNAYIEGQFEAMIAKVRSGEPLSKALIEVDGFQKKLASTILVGEETGSLDEMLDSIADSLDYEAARALEKLVALLEPVLIIVMAIIIGFVVVAVILPIYQSYSTIGQGL